MSTSSDEPKSQFHNEVQGDVGKLVQIGTVSGNVIVGQGNNAFIELESFFRPLMKPSNLFNHALTLVGRRNFLGSLRDFLISEQYAVALLIGRGGIGKSKILREFALEVGEEFEILFVSQGLAVSPADANRLPAKPCIIVVDDAHQRDDLPTLFHIVRHHSHPINLVISTRPYTVGYIRSLLGQASFGTREIIQFDEVKQLSRDETKELARQVLGEANDVFVDNLVSVTGDCPLVTVVGGKLIQEKKINPQLLERDEEFRHEVLTKFREVLVGHVSDRITPERCQNLLNLISAVSPFRLNDQRLAEASAKFLNSSNVEIIHNLGLLEEAGVLLRRGYSLRITPDVLSDHILHEACLTPQGQSTGYSQLLFKEFASICPGALLHNLAELDWRIRRTVGGEANLLTAIWKEIEEEFTASPNSGRTYILGLLRDVALYQPMPVLMLVLIAIRHPSDAPEDGRLSRLHRYSHSDVLHALPELLKHIAYSSPDYLSISCDLLWELGRDDSRELNPYPNHPIRVLQDMAAYDPGKPIGFNRAVLDTITRWFDEPEVQEHLYSPLDILDPLLRKGGQSTHDEGMTFVMQPFAVNPEATRDLRDAALRLVMDSAGSDRLKLAMRAIKSLQYALSGQTYGDVENFYKWVPEQEKILDLISDLASRTTYPLLQLKIIETVRSSATRSIVPAVKQKAQSIIEDIGNPYPLRLRRMLLSSFSHGEYSEEGEDTKAFHQKQEQLRKEEQQSVVKLFLEANSDATVGLHSLNRDIEEMTSAGIQVRSGLFFEEIAATNPKYAEEMCEAIIKEPECSMAAFLAPFLLRVRNESNTRALSIAQRAVSTGSDVLCRSVVYMYLLIDWSQNVNRDEVELVRSLIVHPDRYVRSLIFDCLKAIGRINAQQAISMLLTVELGHDSNLAEQFFGIFNAQWDIDPAILSDEDLQLLIKKLEPVRRIDSHYIGDFLDYAAKSQPRSVVQLLIHRIEFDGMDIDQVYTPLSMTGIGRRFDGIIECAEYGLILRDIRDRALGDSAQALVWIPELFSIFSGGFGPTSLEVLNEWVNSGSEEKIIAVGRLLGKAYQNFVFSEQKFVANLLNRACAVSIRCCNFVKDYLIQSACTSNIDDGFYTPGEPMPQFVVLKQKASDAAKLEQPGTFAYDFYISLGQHAESIITQNLTADEELLE